MDYNLLSTAPLFKGLSPAETEKLISEVRHQVKKYNAGTMISMSGETVTSLMLVLKGMVKGEMVDFAGRVIKIEDVPAPGALASAFMFGNKNKFPVNVVAVSETELLIIDKPEFLRLLMVNGRILVNYLDMISNRSQFLSEKIRFLNFKTIKSKLANFILQRVIPGNSSITLDMTQADIADYFGVARPSVARAIGDMEEEGYILAKGKNLKILDRKGLANLTKDLI